MKYKSMCITALILLFAVSSVKSDSSEFSVTIIDGPKMESENMPRIWALADVPSIKAQTECLGSKEQFRGYMSNPEGFIVGDVGFEKAAQALDYLVLKDETGKIFCVDDFLRSGRNRDIKEDIDMLKTKILTKALYDAKIRVEDGVVINSVDGRAYALKDGKSQEFSTNLELFIKEYLNIKGERKTVTLGFFAGKPVFFLRGVEVKHLLGFIEIEVPYEILIDAKTFINLGEDKPWWSLIAWN